MLKGRSSGLLLPIFSLPGDYGIGTLGSGARQFIDFLAQARQHTWQILPLVPPGSGDSPYMSPSAFAGNPWLLDLEEFVQRGLLTREELNGARYPQPDRVDYDWLRENRPPLLRTAWKRDTDTAARAAFLQEQADWLPDHALFSAIHEKLGLPLDQWPHDIRCREPEAMERWGQSLSDEVDFQVFLQYHFFRQWRALKTYANQKGIAIMGDLPIYVSADSVEVWSQPQLFQMDADFVPTAVAGVPPDAFSDVGQYWGNPLYDWAGHKKELFSWWTRRLQNAALLYDRLRIDHFRGFHTYWAIPASSKVAKDGKWEKGPGQALLDHFAKEVPQLELIAEDLGVLDDDVWHFIHNSGIPGMKILVFAFDPNGESSYLPHNCPKESVVYTGTHDTPTFVQWLFDEASPAEREFASDYLRLRADEGFGWGAICGAWMSPSALAIAPLQDVLVLGTDTRVNFPGTTGPNNWSWRVRSAALNGDVSGKLAKITRTYRRG